MSLHDLFGQSRAAGSEAVTLVHPDKPCDDKIEGPVETSDSEYGGTALMDTGVRRYDGRIYLLKQTNNVLPASEV